MFLTDTRCGFLIKPDEIQQVDVKKVINHPPAMRVRGERAARVQMARVSHSFAITSFQCDILVKSFKRKLRWSKQTLEVRRINLYLWALQIYTNENRAFKSLQLKGHKRTWKFHSHLGSWEWVTYRFYPRRWSYPEMISSWTVDQLNQISKNCGKSRA